MKPFVLVLLGSLLLLPTAAISAQDSTKLHVGVLTPVNGTGDSSFDAGAKAAGDTVNLILEQTGLYDVTRSALPSPTGDDQTALANLAESNGWDFIVFSNLQTSPSEGVAQAIYRLAVFNRAQGKVTLTKQSEPSELLDLFDAADVTVASVLGTMTGVHIGFGKIVLKPSGENGSYQATLDGRPVSVSELGKVLNGDHEVVVQAQRMLGTEVYTRTRLKVAEGKTSEVPFTIPYLTPGESATIDARAAVVDKLWPDPLKIDQMDGALNSYEGLFTDLSYSPRLAQLKQKVLDLRKAWPDQKAKLLEQVATEQNKEELRKQELADRQAKIKEFEDEKADLKKPYAERAYWDTWGWSSLGVGALGLAASAYTLMQVYNGYNALGSATDSGTYNSQVDQVQQYRPLAFISMGLATVGIVAAPFFFSAGPNKRSLDSQLRYLDYEIQSLQNEGGSDGN